MTDINDAQLNELKTRIQNDDPVAMYVYAESVRNSDPNEAEKYFVLASQLGHPDASHRLGDIYASRGDTERAAHCYKYGAKHGLHDCATKLAVLKLDIDELAAMRELEELAESGVRSACAALAAYYKSRGNRKQYNFWHSLDK